MSLSVTLIGLAITAGLFGLAVWRSHPPPNPMRPRLVPWRMVVVLAGATAILFLVHLVNLAGVRTGGSY